MIYKLLVFTCSSIFFIYFLYLKQKSGQLCRPDCDTKLKYDAHINRRERRYSRAKTPRVLFFQIA